MYEEMPISMKSIVHTIGNKKDGGVSGGFTAFSKLSIPNIVNNADKAPTPKLIPKHLASFLILILQTLDT
jgi:hypothetical protein